MNSEESPEQGISTSLPSSESDSREKMGEGLSETEDQFSPLLTEENFDNATQGEISQSEVQEIHESSVIGWVYNLWVKFNQPVIISLNLQIVAPINSPIEPEIKVEVEQVEMETAKSVSVKSPLDEKPESNIPQGEFFLDEQHENNLSPHLYQHLIEQALAKDKAELEQDLQELKSHVEKIQQWQQRRETLK